MKIFALFMQNFAVLNGAQTIVAVRRAEFNVKLVSISYIYIGIFS